MRNLTQNTYHLSLITYHLLLSVLCFSMVPAQETFSDDDPGVAEMMNDKEFQKFLRSTGQAPPVLTPQDDAAEPVRREESGKMSLYRQLRRRFDEENERNRDTIGYKRREYDIHFPASPQRPLSVAVKIDMRQGQLRNTGEEFDLAIEGNGFFQVVDQENGQVLYTRYGSFERDLDGFLSLLQGERAFRLTPPVAVPEEVGSFHVSEDGQIRTTTESGERTSGRLELAVFPNPKRLCPEDDRCFSATPLSGKPKTRHPTQGTAGKIRQRSLEGSNFEGGMTK